MKIEKLTVTAKPTLKVSVISDVVCPWCYIGKRRLEAAINKLSDKYTFEVEYFPFELNPQMPASGLNQKEYLYKKFGGQERYEQLTGHVSKVAGQEGLAFNYQSQTISPNTRKAHRLIQLAKEDGKQLQLVEAFFKAYFTDGVDLSKDENLVQIAESCGMNRDKVNVFLQSAEGEAEVEMAERQWQQAGVTGVPFYVIDNKYGISGAQSPEAFIEAFTEIAGTKITSGEACDVDGNNC
ncbi:MAG TPA: DsbA family oxidoreductase [Chryseosolibacter sp.]